MSSQENALPGNAAPLPGNADVPVGISDKADEDVGAPISNAPNIGAPGWYSRGYLPHRDEPHLLQSITFRLADSLPQTKLRELEEELRLLPEDQRDTQRRLRIEAWLDAGMGCCALRHPAVAAHVCASLKHFDGKHYRLLAWCIMPNHVHALIQPIAPIARIVQGWKSVTARRALAHNQELQLGIPDPKRFWMRDYWDRFIRNEQHLRGTIDYLHQNPVKAGLCHAPEEWPWSSAAPGNADVPVGPP